jgi:predicted DNA-binding ribbon-helix-helix protein
VIFATPWDSFYLATVQDGFFVRMSPSRNIWGHWTMESSVVKRSIVVAGHKTSVSLEDEFWKAVKEIASERDLTLSELVGKVESEREYGNLSSAIRLFVLRFYRGQINGYEGHRSNSTNVGRRLDRDGGDARLNPSGRARSSRRALPKRPSKHPDLFGSKSKAAIMESVIGVARAPG